MEKKGTEELKDFLQLIKKRIVLIISLSIALAGISGTISYLVLKPVYEAKTSVIVGNDNGQKLNDSDVMMYQSLIKTYTEIAKSRKVAEAAIANINVNITPEGLMAESQVNPLTDTQILEILVQSNNAEDAAKKTDALADAFVNQATKLIPTGNVQIIDPARIPIRPIRPNKKQNIIIAFFIGIMLSLGITFLLEYMDDTVKSESDIEKYLGIPVLGVISKQI